MDLVTCIGVAEAEIAALHARKEAVLVEKASGSERLGRAREELEAMDLTIRASSALEAQGGRNQAYARRMCAVRGATAAGRRGAGRGRR